jgi:hypothetical protein
MTAILKLLDMVAPLMLVTRENEADILKKNIVAHKKWRDRPWREIAAGSVGKTAPLSIILLSKKDASKVASSIITWMLQNPKDYWHLVRKFSNK